VTHIPEADKQYFADARSFQYMGKLTYLINPDHNVSVSITGTPTSTGGTGKLAIDPRSGGLPGARVARPGAFGLTETLSSTTAVNMKYAGAFADKKILLDVNAGYFHQLASTLPSDGSTPGDITGDGLAGLSRATYVFERSITDFEDVPGAGTLCDPIPYPSEDEDGNPITAEALPCAVNNYSVGGPAC